MDRVGWGIIGTGKIADKFVQDLKRVPHADLIAVGSRSQSGADTFGGRHGIPHRHARYIDLFHDPEVDIVYIAVPHPGHAPLSIQAMALGKGVLCEKPFAVNARQAKDMVGEAERIGGFLMEGMWTRYLPAMRRVKSLIEEGRIGSVCSIEANFGFLAPEDPDGRLFALELGGGALLDVGVYPVSLAVGLLGAPDTIHSWAKIGTTGVDENCSAILGYRNGSQAIIHASIRHKTSQQAWICGTRGRILIHAPWWRASHVSVWTGEDPVEETVEAPFEGNGFQFEIEEAMHCLHEGRSESSAMPWSDSIRVMEVLDRIRGQWGLRYPEDRA